MSDMMPNYWVGGNPNAMFQNNLAQNQAAMANNQNFFTGLQNVGAQNQASLNNAYGPQGFGGATAQHAALGAAYGRATGGFGGYGAKNADPFTPVGSGGGAGGGGSESPSRVPIASSPFDTGNAGAVPYLSGGGVPFGGGGFGRPPTVFDTGTSGIPNLGGGGAPFGGGGFNPGGGLRGSIAQALMDSGPPPSLPPSSPAGGKSFIDPPLSTSGLGMPNSQRLLGYNPATSAAFTPSSGDNFQSRFGLGFRGASAPSEYTTGPYTDIGGTTHQPNIPLGYATPFSADNPGGALRRGSSGFSSPPMMNADDEPSDTLTPADKMPMWTPSGGDTRGGGGFDPTAFSPSQYQPSSPFGSGGGVGGLRGGSGGLGAGTGTQMPPTALPFFGGSGSGFNAPGSTQSGGLYAGSGRYPALVGSSQDAYGNPFIQGNVPPYARGAGQLGGGIGLGGLDALGQGSVFRGVR